MSKVNNNWSFILGKQREFIEAVKQTIDISERTTPRKITSYVIDHKNQAVTGALDLNKEELLTVTCPVTPRGSVSRRHTEDIPPEYLTKD